MFSKRINSKIRMLLRHFDAAIDAHIDLALQLTAKLKQILTNPVADVITALIPGNIDDLIRTQLLSALDKATELLTIADACRQYTDGEEKLKCFVTQLQTKEPHIQDALLHKLASLIACNLHGGKLKQHLYDVFTQLKYAAAKE